MFKISLYGSIVENDRRFAVYQIMEPSTLVVIYIGHCKLVDVFKFPDLRGNPMVERDKHFMAEVVSVHETQQGARHEWSKLVNQHGRPALNRSATMTRHAPIVCNETGQQWPSAVECARAQGITASALSNHLNNKTGHNTVGGLTYRRVNSPAQVRRESVAAGGALPWVAEHDGQRVTVWQGVSVKPNVIASGTRDQVTRRALEWLRAQGLHDAARAFSNDWGVF